mgnify:CR=1 FL=1
MAKDLESTMKFKLDIKEFKASIQDAKRQISLANAEFKKNTSGARDWANSITGVEGKIKQLKTTLNSQVTILSQLKKEYDAVAKEMGEDSAEVQKLKVQIANQEAAINKNTSQLSQYSSKLCELKAEEKESSSALSRLNSTIDSQKSKLESLKKEYQNAVLTYGKNSKEAKSLASEISNLSGELAKNENKLSETEKSADKLDKSLGRMEDSAQKAANGGFTVLKGALANLVASGFQKVTSAITEQFDTAISRVDTINAYKRTMENLGYSQEDVAKSTESLKKGIEGLPTTLPSVISMQHQYAALSGNIDEATALTLAINDATLAGGQGQEVANGALTQWYQIIAKGKPDAQSWNIINSAMPAQMNQIAESVMGAGKKSQDLFAAWQGGTVTTQQVIDALIRLDSDGGGKLASFQAQAQDASGGMKTSMANIKTAIANGIAGIVEAIGSENIAAALSGIKDGVKQVTGVITEIFNFIKENGSTIIAVITGIATATGAYLAYTTAINVMKNGWMALEIVQKAVAAAQWLVNAAMNANPIGIIIALISALVAAFITLWNNSEEFRNFWISLWEKICSTVSFVINSIIEFFNSAWEKIKGVWNAAGGFFSGILGSIKNIFGGIGDWFRNIFSGAWNVIKGVFSSWGSFFGGLWEAIKNKFSEIGTNIANAIGGAVRAGINLINGAIDLINKIPDVGIGKLGNLNLPRLAKGGVLENGARAVIAGEDGAEAIVPLERNKKWIAKVAKEMLSKLDLAGVKNAASSGLAAMNSNLPAANTVNSKNEKSQTVIFNQTINSPKTVDRLTLYRETNSLLFGAKTRLRNI